MGVLWFYLQLWLLYVHLPDEIRGRKSRGNRRLPTTPLPTFSYSPANVTYVNGELAVLYCSVENLGTKTVVWRKVTENSPLTIGTYTFVADNRFQVNHVPHRNQWNLLIKQVTERDAGVYECQVSSKHKRIRKLVILHVIDIPKKKKAQIVITGAKFVEKGSTIYLACNATGEDYPPDALDWFKEGRKVVSNIDKNVTITQFVSLAEKTIASILKVEKSKMGDAGNYICRTSDLMITSMKVHVINADTYNVKRGTLTQESEMERNSAVITRVPHNFVLAALLWLNYVFSYLPR